MVFAGSVVRSDYDWKGLVRSGRIARVMNYVASRDWVVAIFPRGLEPLRMFDLGGAGWSGFLDGSAPPSDVTQLRYVKGSHGAGKLFGCGRCSVVRWQPCAPGPPVFDHPAVPPRTGTFAARPEARVEGRR